MPLLQDQNHRSLACSQHWLKYFWVSNHDERYLLQELQKKKKSEQEVLSRNEQYM